MSLESSPLPLVLIALGLGLLLLFFWALAPRHVPWADQLTRRHAGVSAQAEWLAPPEVVRQVKRDYLAAYAWLEETTHQWGVFARDLSRYTTGAYLQRQQVLLAHLVRTRGPRFAMRQQADHHLSVRHFSSDGLRCWVIDQQTQRSFTVYEYWSQRAVVRERAEPVVLVFQLVYHIPSQRWLIERFIQRLPPPITAQGVPIKVAARLPVHIGRDS